MNIPDTDILSAQEILCIGDWIGMDLPLDKKSIGRINRGWKMYRGEGHILQEVGSACLVASIGPKNPTYYSVDSNSCTCMDFITRGKYCKHQIYLVLRDCNQPSPLPQPAHRRIRRSI